MNTLHICSRIICGRCRTEYCPNCYVSCPSCTKPLISTNNTTEINADNIKEFYKIN